VTARRGSLLVLLVAMVSRAAMVVWGYARFPPIADGEFYHRFAGRLASGLGYTVAWPDGVVTYAAHYPVGYPAILSLAYRVFGAAPGVAMGVNAVIGALGALAAHRLALREVPPRRALAAGLLVALHPALVFYTPAVMTEGVAAALVLIALAIGPGKTSPARYWLVRVLAMGVVFGVATLVRPQMVAVAPVLACILAPRRRWVTGALVLAAALLTVAPWTVRNCVRMDRCALVSMNGGWNLLIGVHTKNGGWTELDTPEPCRTVWDEAQKDVCFERAAREEIKAAPLAWLSKAPSKLGATFDFFVAGPWYLYRSNPRAFGDRVAIRWAAVEIFASRLVLLAALVATVPLWRIARRVPTPARQRMTTAARVALALLGVVLGATRNAWGAYLVLAIACFIHERGERRSPIRIATGAMILLTMATHAVFFGSGRYGLLVVPLVSLAAFTCVRPKALSASALVDARQVIAGSQEREESPSSKEYGAG
jgi:hypothetical protein